MISNVAKEGDWDERKWYFSCQKYKWWLTWEWRLWLYLLNYSLRGTSSRWQQSFHCLRLLFHWWGWCYPWHSSTSKIVRKVHLTRFAWASQRVRRTIQGEHCYPSIKCWFNISINFPLITPYIIYKFLWLKNKTKTHPISINNHSQNYIFLYRKSHKNHQKYLIISILESHHRFLEKIRRFCEFNLEAFFLI